MDQALRFDPKGNFLLPATIATIKTSPWCRGSELIETLSQISRPLQLMEKLQEL